MLLTEYYDQWVELYKKGAVRPVTLKKYTAAAAWLTKQVPDLELSDVTRTVYQKILNDYAEHHERQTVMDFYHMTKPSLMDAYDEGLIPKDPTRRLTIKGKAAAEKKIKYLNQYQLHKMLDELKFENPYDWLIYIGAKTGLRFSEALGLTKSDFDPAAQTLNVSKTYDYKDSLKFVPTKNKSSIRKIPLDWATMNRCWGYVQDKPDNIPVFVPGTGIIYDSTVNGILARYCKKAGVPEITYHGLRHTHASVLLFSGVSVSSVSRRLGHSSIATTQKVYTHIIREMDNADNDIIMKTMSALE